MILFNIGSLMPNFIRKAQTRNERADKNSSAEIWLASCLPVPKRLGTCSSGHLPPPIDRLSRVKSNPPATKGAVEFQTTSGLGVVHHGSYRLSWALDSVQEAGAFQVLQDQRAGRDDSPLIPLSVHVWHLTEGLACLPSCQSSTIPASRAPTATISPVSMETGDWARYAGRAFGLGDLVWSLQSSLFLLLRPDSLGSYLYQEAITHECCTRS
ncbi:hypothetical protein BJX62DRAFT_103551 [Aspergillus germanicus]